MYFSVLLLTLCAAVAVNGFPTGAPISVCESMMPGHNGLPPQNSPSPYDLILEKSNLNGGESMKITLKGKEGITFRGYFIQARDEEDKPIGEFTVAGGAGNVLNCGEGEKNAVTHAEPSDKKEVTITWTAPKGFKGKVVFNYTIVKVFDTFWVKEKSAAVTIS